jgi:hypothetical protein
VQKYCVFDAKYRCETINIEIADDPGEGGGEDQVDGDEEK